jgi:hypothetical protein
MAALFIMWRDYFGPAARIIGIDLNPAAKKWERDNFFIFVGSQSDEEFWDQLFSSVGNVDVVLDDGGHTNEQQIVTAEKFMPHIKDGGMLIVEDTHTSYLTSFGNPTKYSFINYCKTLIDSINSRFTSANVSSNSLNTVVSSVEIYESMVCFESIAQIALQVRWHRTKPYPPTHATSGIKEACCTHRRKF